MYIHANTIYTPEAGEKVFGCSTREVSSLVDLEERKEGKRR